MKISKVLQNHSFSRIIYLISWVYRQHLLSLVFERFFSVQNNQDLMVGITMVHSIFLVPLTRSFAFLLSPTIFSASLCLITRLLCNSLFSYKAIAIYLQKMLDFKITNNIRLFFLEQGRGDEKAYFSINQLCRSSFIIQYKSQLGRFSNQNMSLPFL